MLPWSSFKNFIDQGYGFYQEILDTNRYFLTIHVRGTEYTCIIFYTDTTDKTDYENNYQAGKSQCLCDTFAGQDRTMFDEEALADGVYEDSEIMVVHAAAKTINVENTHGTNGLNFKVWGSPDASDWEEVIGETSLAAGVKTSIANNDYWKYIKISAEGDGGTSEITAFVQAG